ncbi:MAG: adenylate/guanylate cyclase domain-containing protein [Caldimonas sp.]
MIPSDLVINGAHLTQRLAAILAADVVGYSRLMAADERGTVADLDTARSVFKTCIESSQGRVIDMAGDSVLALFDTATGAVNAALGVQRELETRAAQVSEDRRMRFRIGIHLGDVIVKPDGTVYGDGVNIAARLESLAEPQGIAVSDSIRVAVKGKVAVRFEDQGEQQVKNIADPVRVFWLVPEIGPAQNSAPKVGEIDLSLPDRPSIAVLPFANLSGDPEQEYFTDGVTEDIITELSRFHSLFVIARNSTFSYKGRAVDVRTVAKELGVRYVLEGSIRRASNRIRVTGQLIDALTGNHIWAERYDRVLEDIFAVQEEVTRSIVTAISPQINAAELNKVRRKRPESLSAYELAVRASATARESWLKSDRLLRDQAIREAREALAIDPRSFLALAALASSQCLHVLFLTAPEIGAAWQDGMDAANRAIESDPSDSRGYYLKGLVLIYSPVKDQIADALAHLERALKLNANDVRNLLGIGLAEALVGNASQAIEHLQQALRVSPLDPMRPWINSNLALAHFCKREYQEALEYAVLGAGEAPDYAILHMNIAISHVGLGDVEAGKKAFEFASRLAPELTKSRLSGGAFLRNPENRHRYVTFMRIAAGLEDPGMAEALR